MASFLDYIIGAPRAATPHANVGVNTPPSPTGLAHLASIVTQKKLAKDQREFAAKEAEKARGLEAERLALQRERFGLDKDKATQAKREFFTQTYREAMKLINSGDPDKVAAGEAMLRSAGGNVSDQDPASYDPTGSSPLGAPPGIMPAEARAKADTPSEAAAEAKSPEAKAEGSSLVPEGLREAIGSLGSAFQGLKQSGQQADRTQEQAEQEAAEGGLEDTSVPADGRIPYTEEDKRTVAARARADGMVLGEDGRWKPFNDFIREDAGLELSTTSGRVPKVGGKVKGPMTERTPGTMPLREMPSAVESNIPGKVIAKTNVGGTEIPLTMRDQIIPQTKKYIVDPFGNVVGAVHVGNTEPVIQKAMESVDAQLAYWVASMPEMRDMIQDGSLRKMAEGIVRTTMEDWDGSIDDGLKLAQDRIDDFMGKMVTRENAHTMSQQDILGNIGLNNTAAMKEGRDMVQDIAREHGVENLGKDDEIITSSLQKLDSMLKSTPGESLNGEQSIQFGQMVFMVAHMADSGRLSNQDVERSTGKLTVLQKIESFMAENAGITFADIQNGRYDGLFGDSKVTKDEAGRFFRYMQTEWARMGEKRDKIQAILRDRWDFAMKTSNFAQANGIAQAAASYGLKFPPVDLATAQQMIMANQAQMARQEAARAAPQPPPPNAGLVPDSNMSPEDAEAYLREATGQ